MQYSTILGIESSCDDTSVAVWQEGKILANLSISQEIHEQFGGVVPELASRAHLSSIVPVMQAALNKANIKLTEIDAIGVTTGPGLLGSLLVGLNFAKGLSLSLQKPLLAVNHLYAHVAALYIEQPQPVFPMLTLLVSGGHTQLILVRNYLDFEIIGNTMDDAAGEAFDKGAKLLNLPYPGGPQIQMQARQGNPHKYSFPKAQTPGLSFSFSGIKTSLLYFLRDNLKANPDFLTTDLPDICASYENAIVEYLIYKLKMALKEYPAQSIGLCGGVSANALLRNRFLELANQWEIKCLIPSFEFCTDNAAMIAVAAHHLAEKGEFSNLSVQPFTKGA